MRKKINSHFIEIALFSIIVTTLLTSFLFYTQLKKQVFSDLKVVTNLLIEEGSYDKKTSDLRITVIESDGTVYFDSTVNDFPLENHLDRPEVIEAFESGVGMGSRRSNTLSQNVFYYAKKLDNGQVLRVGKEASSVLSVLISSVGIVVLMAILLAGICLVLSHYLTTAILKPIDDMASDLDNIHDKDVYPELIPFAHKIKIQHEEIMNAANIRQEFTANVTHELKTPLASITGYAELIEAGLVNEKDINHFAGEIHKSADRLLNLINDIIKLSQLDSGLSNGMAEMVNIAEVAMQSVDMLTINASKYNVDLVYEGTNEANIQIEKEWALEIVYNLLENAIRYNKPNGKVYVRVTKDDHKVILSVQDTGIGIPPEHQPRIFERFYRVDKSRSKQLGGTGLGLAIVKHICTTTNADISLNSIENEGTTITVTWNV